LISNNDSLEQALDEHAPKLFAACHFPKELHRSQALQDDVDFWHSTKTPTVSKATQENINRIDYQCETNPLLLLAHAYGHYPISIATRQIDPLTIVERPNDSRHQI
jgi:heme oxygenase